MDPGLAAQEVTRRYPATYGPVNRDGFARWFGIPSPRVCEWWIQAFDGQVTRVEINRVPAWMLADYVTGVATPVTIRSGAPAAGLRPTRRGDHAGRRRRAGKCPQKPCLSPLGVAVAGLADGWPHRRRWEAQDIKSLLTFHVERPIRTLSRNQPPVFRDGARTKPSIWTATLEKRGTEVALNRSS